MVDIRIAGRHRLAPNSWNTLTRPELLRVVSLLFSPHRNELDLRLRLLCVVLNIRLPFLLSFTDVQLAQLLPLVGFITEGNELTAQLLPSVRVPWRRQRYFGPRDSFRNLRFAEFIFADSYFVRYSQDRAPELLNKLLAVLYRPQRRDYRPHDADYAGDRREEFNEHLVEARAKHLARLPDAVKLAIYTWYAGCRDLLQQLYPHVFQPSNQETASAKGWDYVLREMSGGAFGTLAETSQQNTLMVLAKIEDDQEAAERIRQQQAQQTHS
ncbi:hypothetical protein GCM10027346_20670 [Hymenobacter seoulensis]